MSELVSNGVQIYQFPTDDEAVSEINASMNVSHSATLNQSIISYLFNVYIYIAYTQTLPFQKCFCVERKNDSIVLKTLDTSPCLLTLCI